MALQEVGVKKVQKMWRDLKEGYVPEAPAKAQAGQRSSFCGPWQVILSREGLAQKFGMMIDVEATQGGHRISEIRPGGIVDVPWRRSDIC